MKTHTLKIYPRFFDDLIEGRKTWELRKDDRGYQVGHFLHFREFNTNQQEGQQFTGRQARFEITYLVANLQSFGLADDHVIMSVRPAPKQHDRTEK